ncbi:hypothetical protein [Parapedobacter sp. 2B3]|uniref:hypothetical protein n=1 Tax=Parapedobacter sp. 2B3 TaxID=3342381 RepID=UPI0035B65552
MEKQFATYPFTSAGVSQWQTDLAAAGASARNTEAALVEQGLYTFVPTRFTLEAAQVAFLDNLPPALCALWATQIAYAIREQIPITLVKPEARAAEDEPEGTKFIESEGSSGSAPAQPQPTWLADPSYYLRFTVGY